MRKSRLALAGVVALALALTGCGSSGSSDSNGSEGSDQVVIDMAFDVTTLDPSRMNEPSAMTIMRGVYETALRFSSSDAGSLEPLLADYTMSDDEKTLTLTVKDGPTFADGSPITVDDFVFTYQRLIDLKGNPSPNLEGVTVTKVDDKTLTLTSEEAQPDLAVTMANPSLGIIQKSAAEENGATLDPTTDTAEAFFNKSSIGSGPYKIETADIQSQITLVANEDYWGEAPALDRIVFRNVAAATQAINVKAGTADIVTGLSSEQASKLPDSVNVTTEASNQMLFVLLNQDPTINEFTANAKFDEAVRRGIDYDALLELAGPGMVRAAGIIPPMIPGALSEDEAVTTDLDAAKAALEESGYNGETIEFDVANDMVVRGVSLLTVAEAIQAQLKEIGINLELNPQPITTALSPYREGKQGFALWYVQPSQPHNFEALNYLPGAQMGARAGWAEGSAPELEELGEEIRNAPADERDAMFEEFQRIENEIGPFVPLLLPPT
ncbi:MAG: ABC transporter substrate-binding protein, partial [Microbacterium sp.]